MLVFTTLISPFPLSPVEIRAQNARVGSLALSIRLCEGERFRKRALSESERPESERLSPRPELVLLRASSPSHHDLLLLQIRLVLLYVAAASTSFDSSSYAQSGLLLCRGARLGLLPSAQSPVAARACLMRASVTVRKMASS